MTDELTDKALDVMAEQGNELIRLRAELAAARAEPTAVDKANADWNRMEIERTHERLDTAGVERAIPDGVLGEGILYGLWWRVDQLAAQLAAARAEVSDEHEWFMLAKRQAVRHKQRGDTYKRRALALLKVLRYWHHEALVMSGTFWSLCQIMHVPLFSQDAVMAAATAADMARADCAGQLAAERERTAGMRALLERADQYLRGWGEKRSQLEDAIAAALAAHPAEGGAK